VIGSAFVGDAAQPRSHTANRVVRAEPLTTSSLSGDHLPGHLLALRDRRKFPYANEARVRSRQQDPT